MSELKIGSRVEMLEEDGSIINAGVIIGEDVNEAYHKAPRWRVQWDNKRSYPLKSVVRAEREK